MTVKDDDVDKFRKFTFVLGNLIRFIRGQLPALLQCIENASPNTILNLTNTVRSGYGFSTRELSHYENILEKSKIL